LVAEIQEHPWSQCTFLGNVITEALMNSTFSSRRSLLPLVVALSLLAIAYANDAKARPQDEIQVVLDNQVAAWNRGDIAGFMAGYWNSPDLIYLGNHRVVRGWQSLLDSYHQAFLPAGGKDMGTLKLPEEEINMFGNDTAIVWGKYVVTTKDGKARGGLYTLVMRNLPGGWLTVYDRTSSEPE
jgi:ketosteroid isomerase-like protein